MIEFLIDKHIQGENETLVTGLVNTGTILLGSRFGFTYSSTGVKEATHVSFVVKRIIAYGHELDQLPQGMTGQLLLIGDGAGRLEHGMFLADNDE